MSPVSHVTACITTSLQTPENVLHFEGNKGQMYQEPEMTKAQILYSSPFVRYLVDRCIETEGATGTGW